MSGKILKAIIKELFNLIQSIRAVRACKDGRGTTPSHGKPSANNSVKEQGEEEVRSIYSFYSARRLETLVLGCLRPLLNLSSIRLCVTGDLRKWTVIVSAKMAREMMKKRSLTVTTHANVTNTFRGWFFWPLMSHYFDHLFLAVYLIFLFLFIFHPLSD